LLCPFKKRCAIIRAECQRRRHDKLGKQGVLRTRNVNSCGLESVECSRIVRSQASAVDTKQDKGGVRGVKRKKQLGQSKGRAVRATALRVQRE
jgi:hypothetical protein